MIVKERKAFENILGFCTDVIFRRSANENPKSTCVTEKTTTINYEGKKTLLQSQS